MGKKNRPHGLCKIWFNFATAQFIVSWQKSHPFIRHDQYEGNGMGLAIVKQIVSLHQGDIRVESEPGQGATFIVTLPIMTPAKYGPMLEAVGELKALFRTDEPPAFQRIGDERIRQAFVSP